MRIVFLAVDDEFAGEMQRFVYAKHPEWVIGSVISSQLIYKHSALGALLFLLRKSSAIYLAEMIRLKAIRFFLNKSSRFLPSRLAAAHGVEQMITADINDEQSQAKLRSWKPDLIISTNFSHYIGKAVRESIARYGCWNLHKSLLPRYRGMAPVFHALLEGAAEVGATLHVVARGFDTGDVLAQASVPVAKQDTVYSLNRQTSVAGGKLLAFVLEHFDPVRTKATPQPNGNWKTYGYPTRAELKAFRSKNLHFYKPEPHIATRANAAKESL
jgi:methionyl-tRNA formyltransferase